MPNYADIIFDKAVIKINYEYMRNQNKRTNKTLITDHVCHMLFPELFCFSMLLFQSKIKPVPLFVQIIFPDKYLYQGFKI